MVNDKSQHKKTHRDGESPEGEKHQSYKCNAASNHQEYPANYPGWKQWYRNPEYVFSGCVAAFTLALLVTSIGQWSVMSNELAEMKSGSEDTKIIAKSAQIQAQNLRPYMAMQGTIGAPTLQIGERARINIPFTNFGRSLATKVSWRKQIFIGERARDIIAGNNTGRQIMQDFFSEDPILRSQIEETVIVPGDLSPWISAFSIEPITPENILDAKRNWVLLLLFIYSDTSGNYYTTKICRHVQPGGQIQNCHGYDKYT